MLFWPLMRATIDVTSSGNEVPKATIVIPITNFGISKNKAIEIALSTNNSDPNINQKHPIQKIILQFEFLYLNTLSSLGIFLLMERNNKAEKPNYEQNSLHFCNHII